MIKIDFPNYQPKIKIEQNREYIFDIIRKTWIALTPEEWVRQNFINYLIVIKKYPASLIAVEKEIVFEDVRKRFDLVIYENATIPFMVVECKEMNVKIDAKVLEQILSYNSVIKAKYIVLTNGVNTIGYKVYKNSFEEMNDIPEFPQKN